MRKINKHILILALTACCTLSACSGNSKPDNLPGSSEGTGNTASNLPQGSLNAAISPVAEPDDTSELADTVPCRSFVGNKP